MLSNKCLPILLDILVDIAKPTTSTAFLQAYSRLISFPDTIVTDEQKDLRQLLANMDIFLSNTFTFWNSYTQDRSDIRPPMNAKTHGFLDTMYKKMPHVLVLMAVIQTPIDPNIRPLRLSV
jgi:hypothetical protein